MICREVIVVTGLPPLGMERGERSVSPAGHEVDQQMNLVEILLENQLVQLLSIPALRLCRFAAVMDWIAHCECSLKLCFYTLPK
ncbi:MAG: hypothetical protein E6G69_08575 [Alphaproteobacteria bacterium]|nr:MAG: hypothetical protein E6G69_08575 [Alphaproteobacteria bacterium]